MVEDITPYGDTATPPTICPFRHIVAPHQTLDPRTISLTLADVPCPRDRCQLWHQSTGDCTFRLTARALADISTRLRDLTAALLAKLDDLAP